MGPTQKVIKNSVWLIIQPLILNFISIFVIGYIARTLGQDDYGKFVFAFSFITMFIPITNIGFRGITVREIAENKSKAGIFLGKMLTLRMFLSLLAISIIFFTINLMRYSQETKIIVYLASLTVIFQTIITVLQDVFQAYEEMKYVAYTQFISGATLTVLSVIVLYLGYGLVGLTLAYCFGHLVGAIMSSFYCLKKFVKPQPTLDFWFWKKNIYRGIPFFIPAFFSMIISKVGIIFLSKMVGESAVGIYGAASNLTDKLMIIPDGICTAIFPTMAALYQSSKENAEKLFQKFFLYLFLLGLPIAIGTSILAKPIINVIYGVRYQASIPVLQILVWWLFLEFINLLQGYSLVAIHQEKKGALVSFITTPICIAINSLLILYFKEVGVAISKVITGVLTFAILCIFVKKYLASVLIEKHILIKFIIANIIMGFFVFLFRKYNVFLSISIGLTIYSFAILFFRIVNISDLTKLWNVFTKRKEGVY